jgi:hypothetical protein
MLAHVFIAYAELIFAESKALIENGKLLRAEGKCTGKPMISY